MDGIDCEWITENEYLLNDLHVENSKQLSKTDETILRMEHLETVMVRRCFCCPANVNWFWIQLYVHGGSSIHKAERA